MKTAINIKIDKDVRDKARRVAREMGIPLSLVVNAGLRRFIEEQRLVLETSRAFRMSKKLERRLAAIERDIQAGRNLSPAFTNAKDMDAYLDSLSRK